MLPNFLIIGAPRSGTTWLAKNLMEHPQVFIPHCKEVHFFDRNYDKGIEWYESHFDAATGETAVGEGTPAYLANPETAGLIKRHLGDIKLIAVLRDPVDRLYSRHCNAIGKHKSQRAVSFEERIEKNHHFVDEGLYFSHLNRYLGLFPRDRLLVTFYEELKTRPDDFLRRVFSFLGVDPGVSTVASHHVLNAAAAKPLNATSPWLYYLQRGVRRVGLGALADRIDRFNRRDMPALAPATRRKLIEEVYGAENTKLASMLDVDLTHWNTG